MSKGGLFPFQFMATATVSAIATGIATAASDWLESVNDEIWNVFQLLQMFLVGFDRIDVIAAASWRRETFRTGSSSSSTGDGDAAVGVTGAGADGAENIVFDFGRISPGHSMSVSLRRVARLLTLHYRRFHVGREAVSFHCRFHYWRL